MVNVNILCFSYIVTLLAENNVYEETVFSIDRIVILHIESNLKFFNSQNYNNYQAIINGYTNKVKWLLDLFYCIITGNISNINIFINEVEPTINNGKSEIYYIKSREKFLSSINRYILSIDEKIIISSFSFNDETIKIMTERYPVVMLKILCFMKEYVESEFEMLMLKCIQEYRHTDFYKNVIIGYYT